MRCKQDYTVAYENGLLDISTLPLILKFRASKLKQLVKCCCLQVTEYGLKFTYCHVTVSYTFVRFPRIFFCLHKKPEF